MDRRRFLKLAWQGGLSAAALALLEKCAPASITSKLGRGRTLPKYHGISFGVDHPIAQEKLEAFARELSSFHSAVKEKNRFRLVYIPSNQEPAQVVRSSYSFYGPYSVVANPRTFDDPRVYLSSAFHQAAYTFLENLPDSSSERLRQAFSAIHFAPRRDPPEAFSDVRPVFEHSTYLQGHDPVPGTADDHYLQFFASTSTIMRHFPREFLENLRALHAQNAEHHRLSVQATQSVVALYGRRAKQFFPKEVLEYLNASAPKEKPRERER